MAGTVTQTSLFSPVPVGPQAAVNRIALAWTSSSGGAATVTTGRVCGTLVKVEFVPAAAGSAPSAAYDVTLTDAAGVDVLAGQGANLSATTATAVCPGVPFTDGTTVSAVPCVVADALALAVSNAGDTKSGQVILYVR